MMKRIVFSASSEWYLHNFKSDHACYLSQRYNLSALTPDQKEGYLKPGDVFEVVSRYPADPHGTNPLKELRSVLCFTSALHKLNPDIVLSFNPKSNLFASMACWLLRLPFILNVSGAGSAANLKGMKGWVYNTLLSFFYKKAAHIFFQNKQDYQLQVNRFSLDKTRCSVLPGSGVNLEKFELARSVVSSSDFYPQGKNPFVFLMVARLIIDKGVGEFLAAMRKFREENKEACVEFWLVGQKDCSERAFDIEAALQGEKETVKYLGISNDMPRLYSHVHAVVLPSYYPEGTPRSLIEAAASGRPIITTQMPGCQDVVDEGINGFKVQPKEVDELTEAMKKMFYLTKDNYLAMCHASINKASREFSEKIVLSAYDNKILEVLGS